MGFHLKSSVRSRGQTTDGASTAGAQVDPPDSVFQPPSSLMHAASSPPSTPARHPADSSGDEGIRVNVMPPRPAGKHPAASNTRTALATKLRAAAVRLGSEGVVLSLPGSIPASKEVRQERTVARLQPSFFAPSFHGEEGQEDCGLYAGGGAWGGGIRVDAVRKWLD